MEPECWGEDRGFSASSFPLWICYSKAQILMIQISREREIVYKEVIFNDLVTELRLGMPTLYETDICSTKVHLKSQLVAS